MSSVYSEQHSEGGSLVRDNNRSSDGWEMRPDGKWYKIDYYKVQQEEKKESGLEILERFFVGSFAVTKNEEWLKAKNITKVLVLGANSGISHVSGAILRILEVNDDTLFESLDESVTLIKEAIAEGEASGASILMVCPNMLTYCPVVVIAYLMAVMGWSLKTAKERVEGIFKISVAGFMMFTLERWEEVLQSRKSVSVKREVIGTKEVDTPVVAPTITSIAPTVMTVTNPIAVAPPVTYANPVYASYQPTFMPAPVYSQPITTGPLIEATPMYAPTVAAPAYQSYTPSYSGYQYPSFSDYGSSWGGFNSYPQFSNFGYSSFQQPSYSFMQPQQYIQPAQTFSYAQPQQSYTVQAAAPAQAHAQQQQVVQTTTTTSNNVLRGHSSWHSGGVRVNNSHGHSGHRF